MIGSRLGDYDIIASLGRGGFGTVWKAKSPSGDLAAVKLLNPQALDNQRVVKKFFNEAMILAKLDHPNITRLLEFFPDGDNYAIAMEYVEGTELKKTLQQQKGPMLFDTAYKIAHQALDAFQYASESGVLHRDIKPGNIIIDGSGNAKIMDFGIARVSSTASHDTAASMLSIHYVPPERFDKNREIDVRSDIYSLALVFYELFAGRRPFDTSETSQIIFAHVNEIPESPKSLNPDLPTQISDAILRALEKDPDDRFPDFKAFATAMVLGEMPEEDFSFLDGGDDATVVNPKVSVGSETTYFPPEEIAAQISKARKHKTLIRLIMAGGATLAIIAAITGFLMKSQPENAAPAKKTPPMAVESAAGQQPPEAPVELGIKNSKGFFEITHPADQSVMIHIPAGAFVMGSNRYSSEKPIQKIDLDDYYIDKYLVTNGQFRKFIGATRYVTDAESNGGGQIRMARRWQKAHLATWRMPEGTVSQEGKDRYPVSQVSHNDARRYCEWAKKQLPTEAQWEKAARGPSGNVYPWGEQLPDESMANFDNYHLGPTPVDAYEKGQSPYGMFDAAGNLYQWVNDWYADGARMEKNPMGPDDGKDKVIKGGAFAEEMASLRGAHRDRYVPTRSTHIFGFRCAAPYPIEDLKK